MTMLCTLIREQMSYTFFQFGGGGGGGGAHVRLCQLLGGQMSSYAIFHRGAHVRGGGGGGMSYTPLDNIPLDKSPLLNLAGWTKAHFFENNRFKSFIKM